MPIIGTLPVTLVNGTTADATQVQSDLNFIVNQVNANAADATLVALLASANNFTQVQSGIAATAAANFPIASQVQNSSLLTLSSTLGTNSLTGRVAQLPLAAYAVGQVFTFRPSQTNTGAVTLNINGIGAGAVNCGSTACVGGELRAVIPVSVAVVNTTPVFEILGEGPFADARALIVNATNPSIRARFELGSNTPSTTRAYRLPDASVRLLSINDIASQSQMEAGSDPAALVTSARQQFHTSAAKAWISWGWTAGTPTVAGSYNVTSLTDSGAGLVTVNFTTAFSDFNYAQLTQGGGNDSSVKLITEPVTIATGSCSFNTSRTETPYTAIDATSRISIACFGDQ